MVSKNFSYIFVFVFTIIFTSLSFFIVFTKSWQDRFYDFLFIQNKPRSEIVIVALDNKSITDLSGWPIQRKYFSEVLEKLEYAKAVGFDVAFVDNSIYGKIDDLYFQNVIAKIKKTSDQKLILPFQFDDRLEKNYRSGFCWK